MRIAIIGAGALGQQISHLITSYSDDEVAGFFDDFYEGDDPTRLLLGKLSEIESKRDTFDAVIIGTGYKHLEFKRRLGKDLNALKIKIYTYVHPSAFVDSTVKIGEGVVIYPGVVVDMNVEIGDHCILNNGCIISHDSRIGGASFLAPGAVLSGNCSIGEMNFIGVGTVFSDGVRTVDLIHTGAGAVVVGDLSQKGLYIGVPAKLKNNG